MTTRTTKSVDTVVQWPDTIVSSDKTDTDLGPPLIQLLVDLGIKGTAADETTAGLPSTAVKGLPVSVSIIEAGATAASKGWATLIAALGGGTVVWGAVNNFWKSSSGIHGNLVIGAAVVIAACTLGVALIMYGDVRARGQGAAAQYSARAAIATAFLQGATTAVKAQAAAAQSATEYTAAPATTTRWFGGHSYRCSGDPEAGRRCQRHRTADPQGSRDSFGEYARGNCSPCPGPIWKYRCSGRSKNRWKRKRKEAYSKRSRRVAIPARRANLDASFTNRGFR